MKILLVEDEPILAEALAETLTDEGHQVVVADTGTKAIDFLNGNENFDLLITDGNLPGVKGPTIAVTFAKKWPGKPICLASGHLDAEELYKSELGEVKVKFLGKPFSQMDIIKWIESVATKAA